MVIYRSTVNRAGKVTHDGVVSLPSQWNTGSPEYKGREVTCMTVYETIMVVLGVIGLLISLGSLLIALLNFLDERKQHK